MFVIIGILFPNFIGKLRSSNHCRFSSWVTERGWKLRGSSEARIEQRRGRRAPGSCERQDQGMERMSEKSKWVAQLCPALCEPMDLQLFRLLCPWNFPGENTGVGSHSLLQGIFPTLGSNLGLPPCRQSLCSLSHQRPRTVELPALGECLFSGLPPSPAPSLPLPPSFPLRAPTPSLEERPLLEGRERWEVSSDALSAKERIPFHLRVPRLFLLRKLRRPWQGRLILLEGSPSGLDRRAHGTVLRREPGAFADRPCLLLPRWVLGAGDGHGGAHGRGVRHLWWRYEWLQAHRRGYFSDEGGWCALLSACSRSVVSGSATPWTVSPPGILQTSIPEWVAIPFSRALLHPGTDPGSPVTSGLAGGLLRTEPPGKARWAQWMVSVSISLGTCGWGAPLREGWWHFPSKLPPLTPYKFDPEENYVLDAQMQPPDKTPGPPSLLPKPSPPPFENSGVTSVWAPLPHPSMLVKTT